MRKAVVKPALSEQAKAKMRKAVGEAYSFGASQSKECEGGLVKI